MRKAFLKLIFFFFVSYYSSFCRAQVKNGTKNFFNVKIGIGQFYAGSIGGNIEYGVHNVSLFFASGYTFGFSEFIKEDIPQGVNIPSTVNYGFGIRYFFPHISKQVRFNSGLYGGWLYNYYHYKIGLESYDPVVYGGAITLGIEFYINYFLIGLNVHYPLSFLVIDKSSHPYYPKYLTPSIGVGYCFEALLHTKRDNNNRNKNSKPIL
jgi:hypothetical protein